MILFPLTAAVLFLQYNMQTQSTQTASTKASLSSQKIKKKQQQQLSSDKTLRSRYDPITKQVLKVWRDGASNASVVPIGAYVYQEGICGPKLGLECTIYFPCADLSNLIQPDEILDGKRNNILRTIGIHPGYDPPRLLANYSEYVDNVALLTRRGYKGHQVPNQDRIVMLRMGETKIMALFDGHGTYGHDVAHAAALGMLQRLSQLQKTAITKSSLSSTFLQLDKTLPNAVTVSGSTAIVLVQEGNQLFVANLGDSQAFIAEYNINSKETTVVYRTEPHKPHMALERDRIEAAGGRVMLPERPGESSRVIIPMTGSRSHMEMALAMSRSLGDKEGKASHILTAQPTVDSVGLEAGKLYFAVAATDGIFDVTDLEDVARHVGKAMYGPSGTLRPMDACEQLIIRSSNIWKQRFDSLYRDDISIMVSKL